MKTIQMTIDEQLLQNVDQVVQTLDITRSAFIRDALRDALERLETIELERKHIAGYERQPVDMVDVSEWESEQHWGDE